MAARESDTDRYYECLECGKRHSAFVSTCPGCGSREFRTGTTGQKEPLDPGFPAEEFLARLSPFVPR